MSLFWDYFRKTLRWGPIWKDGVLAAVAKGGAVGLDEARDNILWLRGQFMPDTCITEYLAKHAAGRVISSQHYRETIDQYRDRVVNAFAWHEKGGKARGLSEILEYYRFEDVQVYSLRSEDEERWAEFRLYVRPTFWMESEDYDLLKMIANEYKAASAMLESIVVQYESECTSHVGVQVRTASHIVVDCT
jgi:hypothetical protein